MIAAVEDRYRLLAFLAGRHPHLYVTADGPHYLYVVAGRGLGAPAAVLPISDEAAPSDTSQLDRLTGGGHSGMDGER